MTIRWLQEIGEADQPAVGGKAFHLGQLHRHGFPVPDGFCLTIEAYRRAAASLGPAPAADDDTGQWADYRSRLLCLELPQSLTDDIAASYRRLIERADGPLRVAVRSSGSLEDGATHSFAGLYRTVLRVADLPGVFDAVKQCWASLWSEEARAYLQRLDRPPQEQAMAVLIQEMIEGEVSGVIYTAHPLTGNPSEFYINMAAGECDAIVSGEISAQGVVVDRDLPVPPAIHGQPPLLTDDQFKTLVMLADRVDQRFGRPQDIEWTLRGKECLLLQTRPITALPAYFPVGNRANDARPWKLAFMGLFSPFGWSLEEIKNRLYCAAVSKLSGREIFYHQQMVNGYLYDSKEVSGAWWSPRPLHRGLRQLWRADWLDRDFYCRVANGYLETIERGEEGVNREADLQALSARLRTLINAYFTFQTESLPAAGLSTIFPRLLKRFCLICGATDSVFEAISLIQGVENMTLRRDRAFAHLCRQLQQDGLAELILSASTFDAAAGRLAQSEAGRRFLGEWNAFYQEFGYIWNDGNPKDPGWRDNPALALALLKQSLERPQTDSADHLQAAPEETQRKKETLARRLGPLGRVGFRRLLTYAERYYPVREDRNHLFYRGIMAIRTVLHRMGAALTEAGHLEAADDIFYLTYQEVGQLSPVTIRPELQETIHMRRHAYRRYRRLKPPYLLGTSAAASERPAVVAGQLGGEAGSPGRVRGKARIIQTPAQFSQLHNGEVLVCPKVRPFYTPLFGIAAALVTEEGSLLSHGANIAREYGIAAVLGVKGATSLIQNGDLLIVDGDHGTVTIDRSGNGTGS